MLSFDITDRHVRIVKGTEQRGRVRVSSATTIDLQEGLIINGHIKDIPKFATIVNDELKARKMDDKEAVVTLSSNLVLFKELAIPKAKTSTALLTMVTNQMQHTMGTSTDYSVAYSIAGETEQEGNAALKILATACPFDVVDAFRKAFQMLSISLRSVTVTCNSISRIILSDRKNMAKINNPSGLERFMTAAPIWQKVCFQALDVYLFIMICQLLFVIFLSCTSSSFSPRVKDKRPAGLAF